MSADPPTAESRLKALQCHFTWDLNLQRTTLLQMKEKLMDIIPNYSNPWLGHIYNLQGYIHYRLELPAEALQFFTRATETFRRIRPALEGPWLLVNYGNLAWLHHELGQQEDTETYLSNIQALTKELPAAEREDIHPEVLAENAWSLMELNNHQKLLAAELFEKALEKEPDRVEWRVRQVLALVNPQRRSETGVSNDVLQKMKLALDLDPDHHYLRAEYLNQRVKRGEDVKDEVMQLAPKILENPQCRYNGIKLLLLLYRKVFSIDAALDLAKSAAEKHPENRFLKTCLTMCYKWKIIETVNQRQSVSQHLIDSATCLLKEVIRRYDFYLMKEIDLAYIYAQSNSLHLADQKYQELLQKDLEPVFQQMLYHFYAKFLNFQKRNYVESAEYHMKVVRIPIESHYKDKSMQTLQKVRLKFDPLMRQKIDDLLASIQKM